MADSSLKCNFRFNAEEYLIGYEPSPVIKNIEKVSELMSAGMPGTLMDQL